jgi:toxin ParE1/3/4
MPKTRRWPAIGSTGWRKRFFSLDEHPTRAPVIPEDDSLRHLLYGRKPNVYRIIYAIDERSRVVTVLHIRHGARKAFTPPGGD